MVNHKLHYHNIVADIGAGLTVLDKDLRIQWINSSQSRWVGPLDKVCGKHCYRIYEHRNHICRGCPALKVFQSGQIHEANRIGYTENGQKHYFHLTVSPIKDIHKNVLFALELVQDITAKTQEEKRKKRIIHRLGQMYRHIAYANKKLHSNFYKLKGVVSRISRVRHALQSKYKQKIKETLLLKHDLDDIFKVNRVLNSSLDLKKLCQLIAGYTCELMRTDACILRLTAKDNQSLVINAVHGISNSLTEKLRVVRVGGSICGRVAKTKRPLVIDAIHKNPFGTNLDVLKREGFHSVICMPILLRDRTLGTITTFSKNPRQFAKEEMEVLDIFATQIAVAIHESRYAVDIHKSYFDTIHALVLAIESRDPYTRGHTERVTKYAMDIARHLHLSQQELEILRYASEVHDIGKISIPDFVLNKPGKLTPAERAIIELHPVKGQEVLEPLEFLKPGLPIVRHHHERFDGTGYPDGLEKDKIPLMARILACADAFDAMTSDRPYRSKKMTIQEALSEIRNNSGSQFDPSVAQLFIKRMRQQLSSSFSSN